MSRTLRPDTAVVSPSLSNAGTTVNCASVVLHWNDFRQIQLPGGTSHDMTEKLHVAAQPVPSEIPEEVALEIRKLAHELSNALEIIVQTNYLLGTVELKEPGSEWLRMLDNGARKALDINLALRTYIKAHSPR